MTTDIFFRILNFIVLCILGGFFFYKRVLPSLELLKNKKRLRRKKLWEDIALLKDGQQETLQQQAEQDRECQQLREKIDIWCLQSQQKMNIWKQEQRGIIARLDDKRKKQEYYYNLYNIYGKIKPAVYRQLEEKLHEKYSSKEEGSAYNDKVILSIAKMLKK